MPMNAAPMRSNSSPVSAPERMRARASRCMASLRAPARTHARAAIASSLVFAVARARAASMRRIRVMNPSTRSSGVGAWTTAGGAHSHPGLPVPLPSATCRALSELPAPCSVLPATPGSTPLLQRARLRCHGPTSTLTTASAGRPYIGTSSGGLDSGVWARYAAAHIAASIWSS